MARSCAGALREPKDEYAFGQERKVMQGRHNWKRQMIWAYGDKVDHARCATGSAKSKTCTDAGKPPIDVVKFDNQDQAANAVVVGQADAMSADSPVTLWAIKQANGKLVQAGEVFNSSPYGWPVKKGSPLAQSLLQALQHLIDNGTYKQIASSWGVQAGMIDKPVVNGATS